MKKQIIIILISIVFGIGVGYNLFHNSIANNEVRHNGRTVTILRPIKKTAISTDVPYIITKEGKTDTILRTRTDTVYLYKQTIPLSNFKPILRVHIPTVSITDSVYGDRIVRISKVRGHSTRIYVEGVASFNNVGLGLTITTKKWLIGVDRLYPDKLTLVRVGFRIY